MGDANSRPVQHEDPRTAAQPRRPVAAPREAPLSGSVHVKEKMRFPEIHEVIDLCSSDSDSKSGSGIKQNPAPRPRAFKKQSIPTQNEIVKQEDDDQAQQDPTPTGTALSNSQHGRNSSSKISEAVIDLIDANENKCAYVESCKSVSNPEPIATDSQTVQNNKNGPDKGSRLAGPFILEAEDGSDSTRASAENRRNSLKSAERMASPCDKREQMNWAPEGTEVGLVLEKSMSYEDKCAQMSRKMRETALARRKEAASRASSSESSKTRLEDEANKAVACDDEGQSQKEKEWLSMFFPDLELSARQNLERSSATITSKSNPPGVSKIVPPKSPLKPPSNSNGVLAQLVKKAQHGGNETPKESRLHNTQRQRDSAHSKLGIAAVDSFKRTPISWEVLSEWTKGGTVRERRFTIQRLTHTWKETAKFMLTLFDEMKGVKKERVLDEILELRNLSHIIAQGYTQSGNHGRRGVSYQRLYDLYANMKRRLRNFPSEKLPTEEQLEETIDQLVGAETVNQVKTLWKRVLEEDSEWKTSPAARSHKKRPRSGLYNDSATQLTSSFAIATPFSSEDITWDNDDYDSDRAEKARKRRALKAHHAEEDKRIEQLRLAIAKIDDVENNKTTSARQAETPKAKSVHFGPDEIWNYDAEEEDDQDSGVELFSEESDEDDENNHASTVEREEARAAAMARDEAVPPRPRWNNNSNIVGGRGALTHIREDDKEPGKKGKEKAITNHPLTASKRVILNDKVSDRPSTATATQDPSVQTNHPRPTINIDQEPTKPHTRPRMGLKSLPAPAPAPTPTPTLEIVPAKLPIQPQDTDEIQDLSSSLPSTRATPNTIFPSPQPRYSAPTNHIICSIHLSCTTFLAHHDTPAVSPPLLKDLTPQLALQYLTQITTDIAAAAAKAYRQIRVIWDTEDYELKGQTIILPTGGECRVWIERVEREVEVGGWPGQRDEIEEGPGWERPRYLYSVHEIKTTTTVSLLEGQGAKSADVPLHQEFNTDNANISQERSKEDKAKISMNETSSSPNKIEERERPMYFSTLSKANSVARNRFVAGTKRYLIHTKQQPNAQKPDDYGRDHSGIGEEQDLDQDMGLDADSESDLDMEIEGEMESGSGSDSEMTEYISELEHDRGCFEREGRYQVVKMGREGEVLLRVWVEEMVVDGDS